MGDPDIAPGAGEVGEKAERPPRAEEVVYLEWNGAVFARYAPLSFFRYAGVHFYWKGTGTVRESRTCGFWLHFNHLKLVAKIPSPVPSEGEKDDVLSSARSV